MRLVSLGVEHFAGIRRASVSFDDALNILAGPNELGKSSLVDAIRVALLLPATSTGIAEYEPWKGAGAPKVILVFKTAADRFWRVTKTFARTRGSVELETSRDGLVFSSKIKTREADEEIRRI